MASPSTTRPVRTARVLLALLVAGWSGPAAALAYIDPLSGSLIFQAIAAGLLSLVFTAKRTWRWLGACWTRLRQTILRG